MVYALAKYSYASNFRNALIQRLKSLYEKYYLFISRLAFFSEYWFHYEINFPWLDSHQQLQANNLNNHSEKESIIIFFKKPLRYDSHWPSLDHVTNHCSQGDGVLITFTRYGWRGVPNESTARQKHNLNLSLMHCSIK